MRAKGIAVSVAAILTLVCLRGNVSGQHVIINSDTDKVMLCLDFLRSSVQHSDGDKFRMICGDSLTIGDVSVAGNQLGATIDSTFAAACHREKATARPSEVPVASLWDFSLDEPQLEFCADSCIVSCRLRLYASRDSDGNVYETDESLVLVKHGDGWRLEKVNSLFFFLKESM